MHFWFILERVRIITYSYALKNIFKVKYWIVILWKIFRMSLSDSSDSESSGSDQNQDQEPNQSLPSSIEDDNPDDENFGMTWIGVKQ